MKFTVQLAASANDGQEEAVLEKEYQRVEHLGLTLTEAKQLLTQLLQQHVVERQAAAFLVPRLQCPACGNSLQVKERTTRSVRTLFGRVSLSSPRLSHCRCQAHKTATFRPLTALLSELTTPELLFIETKWAS